MATKTVDFNFAEVLESTKAALEKNNADMTEAIRSNTAKIDFINELTEFFASNNLVVKKTEELEKIVENAAPTPIKEVKVEEPAPKKVEAPVTPKQKKKVNF